jgi:DNA (cytosine-5)-methyltransferase 1
LSQKTIVDLFCGAGGFSLGAHKAGFKTIAAIDIDAELTSKFANNFPQSRLFLKDLSRCRLGTLLEGMNIEPGEITGVIGGPPCQGFSAIGKRQSDDPRNQLIGHFFRHVIAIEPQFFLMENVPGLLEGDNRELLMRGIDRVSKKYHILGPLTVDAWDFGAATHRDRAIVMGFRTGIRCLIEGNLNSANISSSKRPTVYDAIHDLPEPGRRVWRAYSIEPTSDDRGDYARSARAVPQEGLGDQVAIKYLRAGKLSGFAETIHTDDVLRRFSKTPPGRTESISRCPRLSWDRPCTTLRAGTGKDRGKYQSIRPIHPEKNRVITVREAARLQGFPDWFQFHDTKWHSFRMIGNSVSPKLSDKLLSLIGTTLT